MYSDGLNHAIFLYFVLDSDLSLAIWSSPRQNAFLSAGMQSLHQFLSIHVGQGHSLLSLITSIPDHQALISCSNVLHGLLAIQSLKYLRTLLIQMHNHSHSLIVHSLVNMIIAYIFNGSSDQLFHIEFGSGVDFSKNHA